MSKVRVSQRWRDFRDGEKFGSNLAEACAATLTYYLEELAKADMSRKPWNLSLSPAYRKWKQTHVGRGTADLWLTGALRREFLTAAVGRVILKTKPRPSASTYIDGGAVPYAAAHQYGNPSTGLPKRRYIRLEENRKKLARQLRRALIKKLSGTSTG